MAQQIDLTFLQAEQQLIFDDPEYFFEEYLGTELWEKEHEIVLSIRDNRKTIIRSCHGSGKTFTVARAALWFMSAFQPAIVINTAPTFRQVANQFWREFRIAHQGAKIPLGGELFKTQFNIAEDWYAIGISTKETPGEGSADKFQGFHGIHLLFIVDEASGVHDSILEAIDGAMSGGIVVRLVYIGNPTRRTGRFAQSFTDSGFKKFHISAFDTPNFIKNGIRSEADLTEEKVKKAKVIIPGLATPEWALEMARKYGIESDVYRVRVRGDFPLQEMDTLIGVDLVEQAIDSDQLQEIKITGNTTSGSPIILGISSNKGIFPGMNISGINISNDATILSVDGLTQLRISANVTSTLKNTTLTISQIFDEIIGLDVARFGDDSSAFVYRKGNFAKVLIEIYGQNTMEIAGRARLFLLEYPNAVLHVDIIGIGAGVFDRLAEQEDITNRVFGVNSALPAQETEKYINLRMEGWQNTKEWLKTANLAQHEGWYQLAKPRYKITSSGKMQLESKEDMKKRKISSPNVADALVLTHQRPTEGGFQQIINLYE